MEVRGIITEVERYALHDGAGIRTAVFLKGCPLRCRWCCNPETQKSWIEPGYTAEKCKFCGRCKRGCGLIELSDGSLQIPREKCHSSCHNSRACADACLYGALSKIGEERSVNSLVDEVSRDITFYDATGGGVTITGGEPMMQPEFTIELLKALKSLFINTAMETCGAGKLEDYKRALTYTDDLFLDIKSVDAEKFRVWTKYDCELILKNIKEMSRLAQSSKTRLFLRIPVVPGFNDKEKEIGAIGDFAAGLPYLSGIELLPYHKLGRGKYAVIGENYTLNELEPPSESLMEGLRMSLMSRSLPLVTF